MNKYIRTLSACLFLLTGFSSLSLSQTTVIHLEEVIDEADIIIIGKLVETKYLFPERFNVKTDGTISTVVVERVLRGDLADSTILVIMIDSLHRAVPFDFFVPNRHLLFLNPFIPPVAFIEKYNLQGKIFYYPALDEFGIINLEEKDGPDYIRRTEDHLHSLPPVPSIDLPIHDLLDSLVSKKHHAFELKLIGDENFVKDLDNHLDNAQKHLARGDSLNCDWQIQNFRNKILGEFERTGDPAKRNQSLPVRFVTKEAYMLLYYHAKYILDRLPKKK